MASLQDHESDATTSRSPPQTHGTRERRCATSAGSPVTLRPPSATSEDEELGRQGRAQTDSIEQSRLLRAQLIDKIKAIVERRERTMASNAFPPLDTSMPGGNRAGASPTTMQPGGSVNGNGVGPTANYMAPLPVGHQQDLNYLYTQIQELGGILRSNREKVNVITRAAEEVAKRSNGTVSESEGAQENDKTRIHELERELAKANHVIDLYKHEQKENTNLIAMYEDALGTATEQIRNYSGDIEGRFLAQRKYYNNLLQQEKDEHLQSRLDRDHWHAQTLKVCEMIRTALRLRTDEWSEEYTVIAGLQAEVRCLRRCLGMEPELPEEETGWPYLKDMPLNDQA